MKTILHIGVENTGTTYLQRTFAANRPALLENGVLFPTTLGGENHIALTAFAVDPDTNDSTLTMSGIRSREDLAPFRWSLRRALRQEIDASGCNTVLLSNEHCSSRLETVAEIERLHSLLNKFSDEISFVVYLRRQDDAHLSIYSTSVRDGWSLPIALPSQEEFERRYDYHALLSRWSSVFGRDAMIVRRYGQADVLDDFISCTGLPQIEKRAARLNQRMNATKLELLRRLNGILPPADVGDIGAMVSQAEIDGPPLSNSLEMSNAIMAAAAESNRLVALEYFDGPLNGDQLFGVGTDAHAAPLELTVGATLDAMAKVWASKKQQAAHLWEHVQMLQATK